MTRSDKRVTKCQFGPSHLRIPTSIATNEHSFNISFKTVHNAKVKLWPPKGRLKKKLKKGKKRKKRYYFDKMELKAGFCHLECVLKSLMGQHGL